jgi:hypothetical protein
MQISDIAVEKSKDNLAVIGRLMAAFKKHQYTIQRWFADKNPLLTTPDAVTIIKEETQLSEEEIVIDETQLA